MDADYKVEVPDDHAWIEEEHGLAYVDLGQSIVRAAVTSQSVTGPW